MIELEKQTLHTQSFVHIWHNARGTFYSYAFICVYTMYEIKSFLFKLITINQNSFNIFKGKRRTMYSLVSKHSLCITKCVARSTKT